MMSLTDMSNSELVGKQFKMKIRSYMGAYTSLAGLQLITVLLSLGGSSSLSSTSSTGVSVDVSYYSADGLIIFTMIWGFVTGLLLTTRAIRYDDFAFVATRMTSSMANILFLVTASFIGGATSMMGGRLIQIIIYFLGKGAYGAGAGIFSAPGEFLMGVLAASMYILLFAAFGYVLGMVVQLHRSLLVLLPLILVSAAIMGGLTNQELAKDMIDFVLKEGYLPLFLLKTAALSAVCFLVGTLISNRLEVRT